MPLNVLPNIFHYLVFLFVDFSMWLFHIIWWQLTEYAQKLSSRLCVFSLQAYREGSIEEGVVVSDWDTSPSQRYRDQYGCCSAETRIQTLNVSPGHGLNPNYSIESLSKIKMNIIWMPCRSVIMIKSSWLSLCPAAINFYFTNSHINTGCVVVAWKHIIIKKKPGTPWKNNNKNMSLHIHVSICDSCPLKINVAISPLLHISLDCGRKLQHPEGASIFHSYQSHIMMWWITFPSYQYYTWHLFEIFK